MKPEIFKEESNPLELNPLVELLKERFRQQVMYHNSDDRNPQEVLQLLMKQVGSLASRVFQMQKGYYHIDEDHIKSIGGDMPYREYCHWMILREFVQIGALALLGVEIVTLGIGAANYPERDLGRILGPKNIDIYEESVRYAMSEDGILDYVEPLLDRIMDLYNGKMEL